jgi:hypothetical protein
MLNGASSEQHHHACVTRSELAQVAAKVDSLAIHGARESQRLDTALEKLGDMADSLIIINGNISKLNEALIKLVERKGFIEKICLYSIKGAWWCIGIMVSITGLHYANVFKIFGKWLMS